MNNLIKLPFIETNISLVDFNKLENNGYLRPIFIELLKAEKIKNIIPSKYLLKVTAEELLLKNNIDQLNNVKNNRIGTQNILKTKHLSIRDSLLITRVFQDKTSINEKTCKS